jgi:hypothetical protein
MRDTAELSKSSATTPAFARPGDPASVAARSGRTSPSQGTGSH